MTDAGSLVTIAPIAIVGIGIISTALLHGWTGWLAVRRLELESSRAVSRSSPATRMELASLKERVRKLEAIASGVDF
jgi:hypothetical protein